MKLDALSHQGKTSRQLGEKWSVTQVSEATNDSERQVQRYIRLTYLIPELLTKVDEGKIAFSPAVEISFLTEDEQRILLDAIELNDCTPSHAQSIRLKKLSQDCVLTKDQIYEIMSEEKPNQQEHLRFRREDFNGYFPKSYTEQQIKKDILKGLELLHRHRQRNKDAR
jgi:ParB family chromosome partitioning protein